MVAPHPNYPEPKNPHRKQDMSQSDRISIRPMCFGTYRKVTDKSACAGCAVAASCIAQEDRAEAQLRACEERLHAYEAALAAKKMDAQPAKMRAPDFLQAALGHMQDRAKTYDKPQGERSMGAAVAAFNAATGHALTETQGWIFMVFLKAIRTQQGAFRADNFEDMAAYAGLAGESAIRAQELEQ